MTVGLAPSTLADRFGAFGGRYVPETLIPALEELQAAYDAAQSDPAFVAELGDVAVFPVLTGTAANVLAMRVLATPGTPSSSTWPRTSRAVTRPASGLPVGSDLEYADNMTLGRALAGRRVL